MPIKTILTAAPNKGSRFSDNIPYVLFSNNFSPNYPLFKNNLLLLHPNLLQFIILDLFVRKKSCRTTILS